MELPLFFSGTKDRSLFWRGEVGLGGGLGGEGAGVRVRAGCSGGGGGVDTSESTLVASTRCWNVCWKLFMMNQGNYSYYDARLRRSRIPLINT